jgi:hypothetical protein
VRKNKSTKSKTTKKGERELVCTWYEIDEVR